MKKWMAAVLAAAVFCWSVPRVCAAEDAVTLQAPSALLMTTDGQVLYEKDARTPREPASVTKVMTLLLACEAIDSG